MKAVVAQYDAQALLQKRDQVAQHMKHLLTQRCKEFNILLDDVSVVGMNFGEKFRASVEAKQMAE